MPLLATLMTLVAADASEAPAAYRQADLLLSAVQRSVHGWERQRADASTVEPDQLLDGFTALGALLTVSGSASRAEAAYAVSSMLAHLWDIRAPGPARLATEEILRFWDQHVGVFVEMDGRVQPRSRVFAEIGAAMAVTRLSAEELHGWVGDAIADPDHGSALLLAAELDSRVFPVLLTAGPDAAGERALAAAEIIRRGTLATTSQQAALVHLLVVALQAGQPAEQRHANPAPLSRYAVILASLVLPTDLRQQRTQALTQSFSSDEQRLIAAALTTLADATADARTLTAGQADLVREALTYTPESLHRPALADTGRPAGSPDTRRSPC